MNPRVFANLLLATLSIYLPLAVFSGYSVIFLGNRKGPIKERHRELKHDRPQKLAAVKDGFLPFFYPQKTVSKFAGKTTYPIGTLPYQKTFYCNEGYGLVKYTSDRFGLRNLDTVWSNILNGSNIFVVGDSFVQGSCVPRKSVVTDVIHDKTEINTINLGNGSSGPYDYMAVLKTLVYPTIDGAEQIQYIVLAFYENDYIPESSFLNRHLISSTKIVKQNNDFSVSPTQRYTKDVQDTIRYNYSLDLKSLSSKVDSRFTNPFNASIIYQILSLVPLRTMFSSFNKPKLSLNPAIDSIKSLSKCQANCRPFIVYIPNSNFWRPRSSEYIRRFKNTLSIQSKELDIPFIDASLVIDSNDLSYFAPSGPHLSVKGYKILGLLISEQILLSQQQ